MENGERKNECTGLNQLFNVLNFRVCALSPYTQNWNWLQWINLGKFDFIVHFQENSVDALWGTANILNNSS